MENYFSAITAHSLGDPAVDSVVAIIGERMERGRQELHHI